MRLFNCLKSINNLELVRTGSGMLPIAFICLFVACQSKPDTADEFEGLVAFKDGTQLNQYAAGHEAHGLKLFTPSAGDTALQTINTAAYTTALKPEEADVMQIDGDYLYYAENHQLAVIDYKSGSLVAKVFLDVPTPHDIQSASPEDPEVSALASLTIYEMHLYNKLLLVLVGSGQFGFNQSTALFYIDMTNPLAPEVVRQALLPGRFADSRRVGSKVYVVTQNCSLEYDGSKVELARMDQGLGDGLESLEPNRLYTTTLALEQATTGKYDNVDIPLGRFTMLTSVDLADTTRSMEHQGVLGKNHALHVSSTTVYLLNSASSLKIANAGIGGYKQPYVIEDRSAVHAFSIENSEGIPQYVASGGIPGVVHGRFSVDEYAEHLRVVSNRRTMEVPANLSVDFANTSQETVLSILKRSRDVFEVVSSISGIAPGEDLTASLFDGELGFATTAVVFKDPLFTFDLSDPLNPRIGGALEVPGFSTFIKRYDDERLITVGQGQGNFETAVSLFDVKDINNPQTIDQLTYVGNSVAMWEHRAFNVMPARKLVAIPMNGSQKVAGGWQVVSKVEVVDIDVQAGLKKRETLILDDALGKAQRTLDLDEQFIVLTRQGVASFDFTFQPNWQVLLDL